MSSLAELTSLSDWVSSLLQHPELLRMGHAQRREDDNLGLGWLYYALARIVWPTNAVVIGSYRGFVPLVLARAMADNSQGGQLHFIDPSLVDDFWKDEAAVRDYCDAFGAANITHHLMTTQEFVQSPAYRQLNNLGIVFIDGFHSAAQARFDFDAFAPKLAPQGLVLLHDSVWRLRSKIYGPGREYVYDVVDFITELKSRPGWQVFDLPFGDGLTLARRDLVPAPPR